jgi:hypothetical protein
MLNLNKEETMNTKVENTWNEVVTIGNQIFNIVVTECLIHRGDFSARCKELPSCYVNASSKEGAIETIKYIISEHISR